MKSDRNNPGSQMMPFIPTMGMPTNMMMFPNFMNDNYSNLDNKVSTLEKKVKVLENRISRLENPYQNANTQNYQAPGVSMQNQNNQVTQNQVPYQTTQNNGNYNGEMYMM